MLLNDFCQVSELHATGTGLRCKLLLDSAHAIYAGHFPGNPVTPGVVEIQLIREILELHYKRKLRLVSISRCKFLKILNPEATPILTLDIEITEDGNHIKAQSAGSSGADIYFKVSSYYA